MSAVINNLTPFSSSLPSSPSLSFHYAVSWKFSRHGYLHFSFSSVLQLPPSRVRFHCSERICFSWKWSMVLPHHRGWCPNVYLHPFLLCWVSFWVSPRFQHQQNTSLCLTDTFKSVCSAQGSIFPILIPPFSFLILVHGIIISPVAKVWTFRITLILQSGIKY